MKILYCPAEQSDRIEQPTRKESVMEADVQKCRACGEDYSVDAPICPRCRVPRKGNLNKPAIAAYGLFLLVMLILGIVTLLYLGRH
jgi:hypothetical protein